MSKDIGTLTSEMHTRPHFASHTQSSLMKRRTPMKLKKKSLSLINDVNRSKRPREDVIFRFNGIHKRQSSIMTQSRSMQMMIMFLKQEQDRRATVFLPSSGLTETTYQVENSLVSFQSDLIKDVSRDLKKSTTGSPAKLTLYSKLTKVVNEFEKHAEDSHASQDDTNCAGRDNSESISISSENRTIVDVAYKLQSRSNDEEESANSRCEVLHRRTESGEKPTDFPNEDRSEIETRVHLQNAATNRKRTRKTWMSRKIEARNEHDVDRACRTDLQNSQNTKHIANPQNNRLANDKLVANDNVNTRKRGALVKNSKDASNQRAWKPPGISKTWIAKSSTSLQPILQRSQLAEKSTASSKNKHSSTEHVEALNSESVSISISANQSKVIMKENRDPRANRMTKICEHLAETKQQQRLQSGGTLPKKKWSRTKVGKVLDKRDEANFLSKSRHCQTGPITKKFSNNSNVEQHRTESTLTCSKRSKTLEVIHTLRKIIDSVREDEDVEENVVNDERDNGEIQTSSNCDASSQSNELHIFTKDVNLDGTDRSSRRSIGTQTELDQPSYQKIDAERDLEEILKLTQIVATQTSPRCNRNVVEVGCNTSNVVYNDVEVSCDLIDFTDPQTEVHPATSEDKSTLDGAIHTEFVKPIKINIESEDIHEKKEKKELSQLSGCEEKLKTLNTETSLKLENCESVEIPARTTSDAVKETEKPSKNSDGKTNIDIDEHQESTKWFDNHGANSISVNNLFSARSRPSIYDYDVSCSSEEVTEYLENDVRYEDTIKTSKLQVEGIPSDVIAAFELAAERARNLHEAVLIYHENLMSRESRKQDEETVEHYETASEFRDNRHASFTSRENEDKMKAECEAIYHFANNDEDFSGFSTCSSRDSSSDRMCEFKRFLRSSNDDYFGIDREEENATLPENEQAIARSILNERLDLEGVKSLVQLLVHRTQEKHALELIQSERNGSDESFETEGASNKILALPATIEKTCLISRKNLVLLICCVVCTVVFWFLQFSFRCDSTK